MISDTVHRLVALDGSIVDEVVPFAADGLPAGLEQTFLGIAEHAGFLIAEQAGQLGLTNVDAILAEVVVVAVHFMNARQLFAGNVVSEAAVFVDPAFLQGVHQRVGIFEGRVGVLEVTAGVGRVMGILVGIDAERRLVFRLLREGNQTAGAHEDTIADVARMYRLDLRRIVPYAFLGRQLDAVDDTQRVGRGRFNGMRLLFPVQHQRDRVGFFVHFNAVENEVLVDHRHLADINIETLVKLDLRLNPGHVADTFRQLQQERPGGRAFHICAGQHVDQFVQFLGNRNRRHIQRDGIGGDHILLGINDVVDIAVFFLSVGHLSIPGQHAAAARRLIKVEAVFTLLVQRHGDAVLSGFIRRQRSSDLYHTEGRFRRMEEEALHLARLSRIDDKVDVAGIDRNDLAFIARLDGQLYHGAVYDVYLILFKVYLIGVDDVDRLFADDRLAIHQVDDHIAVAQRRYNAVFGDGRPAFVADRPGRAFGQRHNVAAGADTGGSYLNGRTDGHVVVFRLQRSVIKRRGGGSGGSDEQRGGNGTRRTVGRTVDDGQFLIADLTGNEGGGAAAVQVDGVHTARFLHDVRDLQHAAAAGEGLLTTVKHHQDNLARGRNTNRGTRRTAGVVVAGRGNGNFAVLDQYGTEAADGFLDQIGTRVLLIPFSRRAQLGRAVPEDGKVAAAGARLVLDAVHDQQSAGVTVGHVIAAGIGGHDGLKVLDVFVALGIAVACLHAVRLVQYARHGPFGILGRTGRAAVIVGVHMHVASADIRSRHIEGNLLAVLRGGVVDLLRDTGRQSAGFTVKDLVIDIFQILYVVAGQLTEVVREGIAAGHAQFFQFIAGVVELTRAFQRSDHLITGVSVVHSLAYVAARAHAAQAVGEQVIGALYVVQVFSKVRRHQRRHVAGLIGRAHQAVHDVEGVQVAVHVGEVEGAFLVSEFILAQIVFGDIGHLFLKGHAVARTKFIGGAQQVDDVARPAADVGMVDAVLVVIGDVHRTKHMAEVQLIAVGYGEVMDVLHAGYVDEDRIFAGVFRIGVDYFFHLQRKLRELRIFVTRHDAQEPEL